MTANCDWQRAAGRIFVEGLSHALNPVPVAGPRLCREPRQRGGRASGTWQLLERHGYHVTMDSPDRTSTSPGLTKMGLPLINDDLTQAATDLVAQSQILQKSVCAGDESQNWMLAKVAGMREHLSRARSAILQTRVNVNHTPGQPIVFDSMFEPCSFGREAVDFAQSQVEQRSL